MGCGGGQKQGPPERGLENYKLASMPEPEKVKYPSKASLVQLKTNGDYTCSSLKAFLAKKGMSSADAESLSDNFFEHYAINETDSLPFKLFVSQYMLLTTYGLVKELLASHKADVKFNRQQIESILMSRLDAKDAKAEASDIFQQLDGNGDGFVSYAELTDWKHAATEAMEGNAQEINLGKAQDLFVRFDADNSGYLDHDELHRLMSSLGETFTKPEFAARYRVLDEDGDGKVSKEEFFKWYNNPTRTVGTSQGAQGTKAKIAAANVHKRVATVAQKFFVESEGKNDQKYSFSYTTGLGAFSTPDAKAGCGIEAFFTTAHVDSAQEKWITDTNRVLVFTLDVAASSTEGAEHIATHVEETLASMIGDTSDAPEVKVFLPGNDVVRICLGMDDEDGQGFDEDLFQGPLLQFIESFSSTLEWGLNLETLTQNLETVTFRDLFALRGVTRLGDITSQVDQMRPLANLGIREFKGPFEETLDLVRIPFVTPVFEENKLENEMSENFSEILTRAGQVVQEKIDLPPEFSLKHEDGKQWLGTDGKLTQDEAKLKQIPCPECEFLFAPQHDITITSKGKTLAIDPDRGVVAVDSVAGSLVGLKFLLTSANKTKKTGHLFFIADEEKLFLTSVLDTQEMADSDSLVELTQSSTGWMIKYPNKGSYRAPAWIAMDSDNDPQSVTQEYADWNVSLPPISTPFYIPRPFGFMVTNEDGEDTVMSPDGTLRNPDDDEFGEEEQKNLVYISTVIDNKTYLVNASGAKLLNCAWTIQGGSVSNALDMPILQLLKPMADDEGIVEGLLRPILHEIRGLAHFGGELKAIHVRNAEGKGITSNFTNVVSVAKLVALMQKLIQLLN
jgi:Ca2+-binding EF-hand superfamily protein